MKRESCDRWTKDDINKFYKGLQLFGTDFGMIESSIFFGKRTRQQIKVSAIIQSQLIRTNFTKNRGLMKRKSHIYWKIK